MLPFTTSVAPSSRNADVGSEILRDRTSLVGTTQKDLPPTSKSESFPARLSINPSASGSFAGLFPILSNGSTAMCFSPPADKAPEARSRTEGISNEAAASASTAPGVTTYPQRNLFWAIAAPDCAQLGCDAFLTASAKPAERNEAVTSTSR